MVIVTRVWVRLYKPVLYQKVAKKKSKAWIQVTIAVFGIMVLNGIIDCFPVMFSSHKLYFRNEVEASGNPALAAETPTDSEAGTSDGEPSSVAEGEKGITPAPPKEIEKKICDVFGDDCATALAIAKCESHLDPYAWGDKDLTWKKDGKVYGDSHGIFQIRAFPNRPDREWLTDVDNNIEFAHNLRHSAGWESWLWCYENRVLGA